MKRDFIFGIAAAFALAGLAAGCSTRDTDAGASGTGSLQLKVSATPVSYTHIRAHETDTYLVCRLLLENNIQASDC